MHLEVGELSAMNAEQRSAHLDAITRAVHCDPFAVLGAHRCDSAWVVRCLLPEADVVEVMDERGAVLGQANATPGSDVFEVWCTASPGAYRLRIHDADGVRTEDDAYRFQSPIGELDRYLLGEGRHLQMYDVLGAHCVHIDGIAGVHFGVWAPNAQRVSVVGAFNNWDGRRHPMRRHPGNGVWDLFLPGCAPGAMYKFELLDSNAEPLPLKADPFARRMEAPPGNACIVNASHHQWADAQWMATRDRCCALDRPMSIYEVHLGSWRHALEPKPRKLSYLELADQLVAYVKDMGFTHVELLPITEHPFEGSWGYQPIGLFAPTYRHGEPDGFKVLVDAFHRAGIAVILDWVAAHFPRDEHGLARFDGSCLYEHEDTRRGEHRDWGTLIYNYGRREVENYLIASALWWTNEYHIDALRVDAVASMLYLDYSRNDGDWLPNEHGGNENLQAVEFLRRLNVAVHGAGAVTMAEESTDWPGVSRPAEHGGLGFSYKWNMGWMHDTLAYISEDAVHRSYHHERMSFGLLYAFGENYILPLSHDEVVHGKGSLIARMPGDDWQAFANLRVYLSFMYASPGKKLLFMGGEFAQRNEWNVDGSLDWHLLDDPLHQGVQRLLRDLNYLHSARAALHRFDTQSQGFEWVSCDDRVHSVFSFLRRGAADELVLAVFNFTPVVRDQYHIGVPCAGCYVELLNSDAHEYGGSGVGNLSRVCSVPTPAHGYSHSIALRLPPLAALYFAIEG
ncbi:MAG: 1,4-alpha-glucan branching enzyme [Gammaproteobacteria bacterium]